MPAMDYHQFKKWITANGYRIGHSTKHHNILDADGKEVGWFAVAHKKGGKDYVKSYYVKKIKQDLGI